MALSIRNEHAEKLAREVALESNESITQAIINALEERLERLRGRRKISNPFEEIMAISQRCSALPDIDTKTPEQILNYGKNGVLNGY